MTADDSMNYRQWQCRREHTTCSVLLALATAAAAGARNCGRGVRHADLTADLKSEGASFVAMAVEVMLNGKGTGGNSRLAQELSSSGCSRLAWNSLPSDSSNGGSREVYGPCL